jgi:hypothetical protein
MNMATNPETVSIVLTDEQISAGAAVLCDCRKPRRIGRNAAINVVEAMAGAAPPVPNAPAEIRTWRARIRADESFPLHAPTDVEQAMVAEIAELRAAAAAAGQQPGFRCPTCCAPAGQPCAVGCPDAGLAGAVKIAIGLLEALDRTKLPLAVSAAIGVLRCARPAQAAPDEVRTDAEPIECWSRDEEDFSARSLDDLLGNHDDLKPGDTVWVGDAVHPDPKQLVNEDGIIENIGEAAYDIAGEHAEDYPNVTTEQAKELESLVADWIKRACPPTFWTVENIKPYVLSHEDFLNPTPVQLAEPTDLRTTSTDGSAA